MPPLPPAGSRRNRGPPRPMTPPTRPRYPSPGMARIAVVGAGAVGSYYGARLQRAGHDVRFLVRRDLAAVQARGLDIRSVDGDFTLPPGGVHAVATPAGLGQPDWLICALKTTALGSARSLLGPAVGSQTRVVALMNGLNVEEQLARWFGPERVFGAMAFVCINRGEPGVVHHLRYGRLSIGHACDDPDEAARLHDLLAGAGLDVVTSPNLRYARWEKLCWNVPFNGLSVAAGGVGTESILADPPLRALAERAMREVVLAGNADLAARGSSARLPGDETVARLFALTETMGDYATSMALDYLHGRPLEVEAILGEPVRAAAALGVTVPTMDALYALVRAAGLRIRGDLTTIEPAG